MIKTSICSMLGIEYPIFQGGMAWISDARLAAAVSNAGGLGIISAMNGDAEYLRAQIRAARQMTDKPFGVNIMLMSPIADEYAKVVAEESVAVVTTGAGSPMKYIDDWKAVGIKVIPVVASAATAKLMSRAGVSAIIAEGCEAGGHIGETTTMSLIPQVCDATDLPVIAAGGIADGRGIAAAFMLGALGVQLGTRFIVADECPAHQNYKDRIIKATDISTTATGRRLGHPVRSLKTPFTRAYMKAECDYNIPDEELEARGMGAYKLAALEGNVEEGCFLAGQIAGLVRQKQPAADIIRELVGEVELVLHAIRNEELGVRSFC